MLVNMVELLKDASEKQYGIIAACPLSMEEIEWAYCAAEKKKSPLIVCCNPAIDMRRVTNYENNSLETIGKAVKYYSVKHASVPSALCLDHGDSIEIAYRAIKAGYTGVMVDKSMFDFETNKNEMIKVCKIAHAANVGVEAGLGGTTWRDPTPEEIEANLTKINELAELSKASGVDIVAVFVGGSHGDHKSGQAILHYDLIEKLRDCSDAMLCMHGSSQTGDEKLAKAAKSGICKFNTAGDLLLGGSSAFEKYYESNNEINVADSFASIRNGYTKRVEEFMSFLGSEGKC